MPKIKSKEQIIAENAKYDKKYGDEKSYTCHNCPEAHFCKYAWDLYNTNGECIVK